MIFICAGLGGGTGSGAAPCVAQLAREAGALVIVFRHAAVLLRRQTPRRPGEGGARSDCNESRTRSFVSRTIAWATWSRRKPEFIRPSRVADVTISQSVRSIVNLIQRPGLIRIGFDDLLSALRSQNGRCLFGFGESDCDNRATTRWRRR